MQALDKLPNDNEPRMIEYNNRCCGNCIDGVFGHCDRRDMNIDNKSFVCDMHRMASFGKCFPMYYYLESDYHGDESRLLVDMDKSKIVLNNGQEMDMSKFKGTEWYSEKYAYMMMKDTHNQGIHDMSEAIAELIDKGEPITKEKLREIRRKLHEEADEEYKVMMDDSVF